MKLSDFYQWVSEQRKNQRTWGAWLVLIAFLVILYMVGLRHWHVVNLFVFVPLFFLLCLGIILAVGLLQPTEDDR